MIAGNHVRSCIALTGLAVLLAACAAPESEPSQGAANPIVRASIGAAALSWVEFADGRTAVSDDAGLSWRALRAPQAPASGASVALSGHTLTVVALSGSTLTVQRSGDDGVSWKTDAHELSLSERPNPLRLFSRTRSRPSEDARQPCSDRDRTASDLFEDG